MLNYAHDDDDDDRALGMTESHDKKMYQPFSYKWLYWGEW